MEQSLERNAERTRWFMRDRFGMFIHWGLYSIPARGEWVRCNDELTNEEYEQFFDEFNPEEYDPREWARLAKAAGMRYAVLTAKHHDGFCLFDSRLTDYKSTKTKAGRDLVREFLEAFRAEGLRVGLYYSVIDWHHPDYPHYGDSIHPCRAKEEYKNLTHDFDRYLDYMHGQVEELCRDYGKIDIMWFDFSYGEMSGEKWRATDLIKMVRSYQPDIITDNRLEAGGDSLGSICSDNPSFYAGDFASPEQIVPPGGIRDMSGRPVAWEACITMNNSWGYNATDDIYKSPRVLIRKLAECVSKNGNMLLNVGPDARGLIPEQSVCVLRRIGEWMDKNGESIYGCCDAENLPKPDWGLYTQNGNMLYAHVFEPPIGPLGLPGIAGKVKKLRLLRDRTELKKIDAWNARPFPGYEFVNFGSMSHFTYPLPDGDDTVIAIELCD